MKKAEQVTSLFWIGFAIWVCIASLGLELGTLSDPGPGLLPFGTGALLGLLAAAHFTNVTLRPPEGKDTEWPWLNVRWQNGVYVVLALFAYVIVLPTIGYLIDTFLLMLFLFSVLERKRWWAVLLGSLLVIGMTYLVFGVWLMVQFPKGFLRFG